MALLKKNILIDYRWSDYGLYPDDNFKPSVFFFKFLAMKIGHHTERKKKKPSLLSSMNIVNNKKIYDEEDDSIIYL